MSYCTQLFAMLASALVTAGIIAAPAEAETKVALVVGIGRYASQTNLPNPTHDARDMARMLKRFGFELLGGEAQVDVDRGRLLKLLDELGKKSEDRLAVVYLAGHGAQYNGHSYILPRDDDKINFVEDLPNWAVAVDQVLERGAAAKTLVVLVDACRDNALRSRDAPRSLKRGLSRPEKAPPQSIVVYATQPGETASDGPGRNSPFAMAAIEVISDYNAHPAMREVGMLMRRLGDIVRKYTNERQSPQYVSNLTGEPVFLTGEPVIGKAEQQIHPLPAPPGTWTEKGTGIEFVYLEREEEGGGFYLAKYEVTQAQWTRVMKTNPSRFLLGEDWPVESVSMNEILIFLEELNATTDRHIRLPTESEWQYACKVAGTDDLNCGEDAASKISTFSVKDGNPNLIGALHLAGNVAELVGTCHLPKADSPCKLFIVRGGSWWHSGVLSMNSRGYLAPNERRSTVGFRLATDGSTN